MSGDTSAGPARQSPRLREPRPIPLRPPVVGLKEEIRLSGSDAGRACLGRKSRHGLVAHFPLARRNPGREGAPGSAESVASPALGEEGATGQTTGKAETPPLARAHGRAHVTSSRGDGGGSLRVAPVGGRWQAGPAPRRTGTSRSSSEKRRRTLRLPSIPTLADRSRQDARRKRRAAASGASKSSSGPAAAPTGAGPSKVCTQPRGRGRSPGVSSQDYRKRGTRRSRSSPS